MGSLKTLALAGALAVGASTLANAADYPYAAPPPPPPHEPLGLKGSISSGWYLRGDVGVGAQSYGDIDVKVDGRAVRSFPNVNSFSTKASDHAFASFVGVGIGYQFNSYFRADITGEYRGGSITGRDQLDFSGQDGFGTFRQQQTNSYRADIATFVGLVNGYIDLGTWNCLTPYLGAGIGFASHTINGFSDNGAISQTRPGVAGAIGGTSYAFGDSVTKTNVAWALMAGVAYDVTSNLKLELGYRYLNMGDAPEVGLRGASGQLLNPSNMVKFKELDSHDIKIGMRWNFSDPSCCGPKEQPVAYAPAPHVIRKY